MFNFSNKEISNIILHIICVTSFISIFFFTYTKNIEEIIVKNQVKIILKHIIPNTSVLNDDVKSQINILLNNVQKPDLSKEDELVEKNNEKVFNKAAVTISIASIIGIIASYLLFQSDTNPNKGTYFELLQENAILVVFVALTEFLFLHLIATNYVYGDANLVSKQILQALKKYSQ